MRLRFLLFTFLAAVSSLSAAPFGLKDGDRVAFIGDTLMEREQYSAYIELALASHFPDRKVSFRNLGWSGDTPHGDSRYSLSKGQAGHEPADEAWNLFKEQIQIVKPTVVFLGYGMANSFDGQEGLGKFKTDLTDLVNTIQQDAGSTKVQFVIVSPFKHENLGAPLLDPAAHNAQLALYTDALRQFASEHGFVFVDLFTGLNIETRSKASRPLTDNGIHLNERGYQAAAEVIEKALGLKRTKLTSKQLQPARKAMVRKNEFFFGRSRPQNMAYLLGFRKAEQGKNAGEIVKFDAFVEAEDQKIWSLLAGKKSVTKPPAEIVPKLSEKPFTPQPLPEFQMAPGFEATLWAENPLLAKPIQMNFDAQGRLWVASSAIYPQIEPGQKADDKIIVLEDTNGDGKADKSKVFVDGLLVPTAVLPGDGGVYVGQSTELLHFKDTNNDGKADERKIVLASFGTEDSHHNVHTLRWAPDGQMYFQQSIYIRSDLETPHGVVRLKSGGVFNLRPQTMELDVFLRGFCNPWGHIFDTFGQSFVTDGCGSQGISYSIRDATYSTYAKMRRELKSISPGSYPKFCGLEVVHSENFPADWQGNMITSDFRAHRVVRFSVSEDGAGFAAQEVSELMRTTNVTFRPIDAKFGPDGALYVADWSNPIINHGEVDFRDPRRDHEHGRIWRITAKNRPAVMRPNLVKASNSALMDQLLSPNGFNVEQARRVLTERGAKIQRDVDKWTAQHASNERALLEALWINEAIGTRNIGLLEKVLAAQDGRIRAAGVKVVGDWHQTLATATQKESRFHELLSRAIRDSHPRVRLEAVRALARVHSPRSAELVLQALDNKVDSFLDYAIWLSINDLAEPWLAAIRDGQWKPEAHPKQLEFGVRALEPNLASEVLDKVFAKRTFPADGSGPWIDLVGSIGSAPQLRKLYDELAVGHFTDNAAERAINALNHAARTRNVTPGGNTDLTKLYKAAGDKTRAALLRLAGAWKSEAFRSLMLDVAGNPSSSALEQNVAFEALGEIGFGGANGADALRRLQALTAKDIDSSIRRRAAIALSRADFNAGLTNIVNVLISSGTEDDAAGLWRSLLNVKNAGTKLAAALPKSDLPLPVAKAGLKIAREGGKNEADLILAITRSANLDDKDKTLTPDEMKQLAAAVTTNGDPARGEKLFRNTMLGCVNCHAIGGAGGKVGPDLTSIGASAPVDYLIESLLYPNSKIKEGYHTVIIATKDEQEFSGIVQRETDSEVVIRDSTGKDVVLAKNNVQSRKNGGSLMPSGLTDNLTSQERADLVRFMSELGKPGPYDASKGNVARAWRIALSAEGLESTALPPPSQKWESIYTTVNGDLLREVVQEKLKNFTTDNALSPSVYASARLQLSRDTDVSFQLSAATGSELFIDGSALTNSADRTRHLSQGKHTVLIKMAPNELPEKVRLQVSDGTFLVE